MGAASVRAPFELILVASNRFSQQDNKFVDVGTNIGVECHLFALEGTVAWAYHARTLERPE